MTGFLYTTHAPHNPLVQALVAQGLEVRRITFGEPLSDLQDCLAFYGNLFDEIKCWRKLAALKRQLHAQGVPYVFWNRDAPWNTSINLKNRLAMQWLKPVDVYLAHSLQTQEWFGGEAYYFPNAAQPTYYSETDLQALRDETHYEYDVSFFGSFGNTKDANARARLQFLTTLESLLKIKLPAIRFKAVNTAIQPLTLSEQMALIRTSKINLNYGAMCDLPGNRSWGLPERVFGIPAAGGYLLTDDRQSIPKTFPTGLCDTFANPEECAHKIAWGLGNFPLTRTRAERLHHSVLGAHTYSHRAQAFIDLLESYRRRCLT